MARGVRQDAAAARFALRLIRNACLVRERDMVKMGWLCEERGHNKSTSKREYFKGIVSFYETPRRLGVAI